MYNLREVEPRSGVLAWIINGDGYREGHSNVFSKQTHLLLHFYPFLQIL